ncbi:MAG: hypothetical protein BWK80_20620 [Desulfobacteraceae bacterium IS3]|nr:MAG: hypothetical protein BWK80_20620 [Desulfobacteraceae bacterium IS3]
MLYRETRFENHDIGKYPWCHLKLLTETCARKFRENDERGLEELLTKEIGSQKILYWDNIPEIIENLNLEQIRKEGGPWHIYAKIVLHSGVPANWLKNKLNFIEVAAVEKIEIPADMPLKIAIPADVLLKKEE